MKLIYFLLVFAYACAHAVCNKPDHEHKDPNIVRCLYNQEDIYRGYSKKCNCYGCRERWKECFFCGCSIDDHTKVVITKDEKKHKRNWIRKK